MLFVAENLKPKGARELADIRKSLRLTQEEMSQKLGMTMAAYRMNEYRDPSQSVLDAARSLIVREQGRLYGLKPSAVGSLKVLGSAGAGESPIYAPDEDQVPVPIEFARDDFAGLVLESSAVSMMPYLQPGDVLIFKHSPTPRVGKIVAARLPAENLPVVKKLVFDDGSMKLRSLNATFADMDATGVEMLGYLVGIISADLAVKLGPYESGIDETYIDNQLRTRLP